MNNKYSSLQDLQRELARFREYWAGSWPGLPAIATDCLLSLGYRQEQALEPHLQAVLACIGKAAAAVEQNCRERELSDAEPAYHNRLHIADTLASLACLLLNQRAADGAPPEDGPSRAEWLMMLAMVAHDYLHTGRVNQFPAELEQASVDGLRPLMADCGMADEDQALVAELILMTDPTRVGRTHDAVRSKAFDLAEFDAMAVLLQESDILASALPQIGIEQTRRLAVEWAKFSEKMASGLLQTGGRIVFLRDYARFSSPASERLGIQALIDQQLSALSQQEASAPL